MLHYKILVVENDSSHLSLLQSLLVEFENSIIWNITIAKTYDEALHHILTVGSPFDFSILDYLLDDNNTCIDLLGDTESAIQKYGRIIFTTTDVKQSKQFQLLKPLMPACLFLNKPFSKTGVSKIINSISIINVAPIVMPISLNMGTSGERRIEDINSILFIEGNGHYSRYVFYENSKLQIIENAKGSLRKQFDFYSFPNYFLRVHNYYIVNALKIKYAQKDETTSGWLSFTDNKNDIRARYSTQWETFEKLKQITRLTKLD